MKLQKLIIRSIFQIVFLVCIFIVLSSWACKAQINNIDSLLKVAQYRVYENPKNSIDICNLVLKNPSLKLSQKINAKIIQSTAYNSLRNLVKSLECVAELLEFLNKDGLESIKTNILNTIGAQYYQLKIFDKSLEYLDQALSLAQEYPHKDSIYYFLGKNYALRGLIYRDQLSCDVALEFFDKSIANFMKLIKVMPILNSNVSIVAYNKANCYLVMGRTKEAHDNFLISLKFARVLNNPSLVSFAKKGIAEIMKLNGDYENSIQLLNEALNEGKPVGDIVLNNAIYKGLYENYLALNNTKLYSAYYMMYKEGQYEIRKNEMKTINQSLINSSKKTQHTIKSIEQNAAKVRKMIIVLIIVIITAITILLYYGKRKEVKLRESLNILVKNYSNKHE